MNVELAMGIKNNCPPETIVTERLKLRISQRSDTEAIFQGYAQDPEVVQYLAWRPHQSIEETRRFVEERIVEWKTGKMLDRHVFLGNSG